MLLTRKTEFSASHFCFNSSLPESRNLELFGSSANRHGHGHNFVVEVTLRGDPDPVTGMVFDLKSLKDILNREVVDRFDHRFLNHECPPFDRVIPTTENLAIEIWNSVAPRVNSSGVSLHAVRVYETPELYVDYLGAGL